MTSFQAALRAEAQKMTQEISYFHEEIASNKEQIELVSNRSEQDEPSTCVFLFAVQN